MLRGSRNLKVLERSQANPSFFGELTNLEVSGKSKENLIFGGASDISILGKVQELQDVSLMEWWRETAERFGAE